MYAITIKPFIYVQKTHTKTEYTVFKVIAIVSHQIQEINKAGKSFYAKPALPVKNARMYTNPV